MKGLENKERVLNFFYHHQNDAGVLIGDVFRRHFKLISRGNRKDKTYLHYRQEYNTISHANAARLLAK